MAGNLLEQVDIFEKELKLPKGFFKKLLKEDDWSFIIKIHSLVEAAVTYLLVKEIKKPLENSLYRLELSSTRTGKIAFLKDLGLLEEYRSFIKRLSEIRNNFVHDISNINISLNKFLDNNNEIKKPLVKDITSFLKDNIEIGDKKIPAKRFAEEHPKSGIWVVVLLMLKEIYALTILGKLGFTLTEVFKGESDF